MNYPSSIKNAIELGRQGSFSAIKDAFEMCLALEKEDSVVVSGSREGDKVILDQANFELAHEFVKDIRKEAAKFVKEYGDEEALLVYKRCLLFDAPYDLDAYLLYLEFDRDPEKKFYEPRRNVMLPLVKDLEDLYYGRIDLLAVSLPPRVGKSTLCIYFLSWVMGNRPDVANVMSGHSDKLTSAFFREIYSILTDSITYNWGDVFPGSKIVGVSSKNETIDLNKPKRFPTFTARSIGGTLTGAVEVGNGGLLYCDDLVEDLEESLSAERMQAKWDAYSNQLKDRKKLSARELHVGTRWSCLDPIGRIKEQYEGNPRYRFVTIPALNENGESNFDYPYSLGFDTAYYNDMKESIDDATWCAKYMGEPYFREGLLFPNDVLRRYYEIPDREPDAIWSVCDTAQGHGDYTFMPVFYQYGNDHYMVDCVCSNAVPSVTDIECADMLVKYKVRQCQYEINAGGGRTADNVQELIKQRNGITRLTKHHTQANKETKILSNSTWIKDRILFLDESVIKKGSQYASAMKFLTMYVVTGKNKHDDVPDGLAQYAEYIIKMSSSAATVMKRLW